jgi:hypothetical protein
MVRSLLADPTIGSCVGLRWLTGGRKGVSSWSTPLETRPPSHRLPTPIPTICPLNDTPPQADVMTHRRVERDLVDRPLVPRQRVGQLQRVGVPHVDNAVGAAGGDALAVGRPAAAQQQALEGVLVAGEDLDAPGGAGVGVYVWVGGWGRGCWHACAHT